MLKDHRVLEAHGTGTALGDPIEVGAAAKTLQLHAAQSCCTSMKALVGHAEAASGGFGGASLLLSALPSSMVGGNAQL